MLDEINNKWENLSREELVEEYIETQLATLVNFIGTDWRYMPHDVSQDPIYWKSKDKDIHNMHIEIAKRYHINRDECLWLLNIVDDTNLYCTNRLLKPLIEHSISLLEKLEEEKKGNLK